MSQVRKFQPGGSTPERKLGKFIINGHTLEGQAALDKIAEANAGSEHTGMGSVASMAIERGGTAEYNPISNTIKAFDSEGNDITDDLVKEFNKHVHASTSDSRFKKNFGATFRTATDSFKRSGFNFKNIKFEEPETPKPTLEELRRGNGWFNSKTIKGEDGKDIILYDNDSVINKNNIQTIQNILNWASDPESESKYSYSKWVGRDTDRARLRELSDEISSYNTEHGENAYLNDLVSRIKSNNYSGLSQGDLEILSLMGFNKDAAVQGTSSSPATESATSNIPVYNLAGLNTTGIGGTGITGVTEHTDDNGEKYWTVEGLEDGIYDLDTEFGNKIFGNTDFAGGWIWNGRLYNKDAHNTNIDLQNAVRNYVTNNNPLASGWYSDFQNSGVKTFDPLTADGQSPFLDFNPNEQYITSSTGAVNQYFRNLNHNVGIMDVTEQFPEYKNQNHKVLAYVDTGNSRNNHGVPIVHYIDETGKELSANELGTRNDLAGRYSMNPFEISKFGGSAEFPLSKNQTLYGTYGNPGQQASVVFERGNSPEFDKYYLYEQKQNGNFLPKLELDPTKIQNVIDFIKNNSNWSWNDLNQFKITSNNQQISGETYTDSDGTSYPVTKVGGQKFITKKDGTYVINKNGVAVKYRKDGGKIDWDRLQKLQFGGYIANNKATAVVNNNFKNDIQNAHALDGSDGGLTDSEKLQIAGALADLGGVGASFAPGLAGGIAGAGIGVTGTALRFAGDVKHDGLDWGDVGRGLVNLAFDVAAVPASLLPAGDNAIKGAKFVRTIKNVGQPLLKWMGTIGCSSALINTATKIINGEKYTSEDLTQLAHGLAGGIVAGKQWTKQIGDAKLASKLSSKAATTANTGFSESTVIEGTGKSIKNEDLDDIVKTAKGDAEKIKSAIKAKLKLGEDTEIDLSKLGISKGEGNIWQRITKKDGRMIYEKPEKQEATSALNYFIRGKARNEALGYRGKSSLLDNLSEEEYRLLISRNPGAGNHTITGAVRRAALSNPSKFNFKFTGTKTVKAPGQFGWNTNYRTVNSVKKSSSIPADWKANYDFGYAGPINEGGMGDPFAYEIGPKSYPTSLVPVGETRLEPIGGSTKFNRPIVTEANLPSGETIVTPPPTFKTLGIGENPVTLYRGSQYRSTNNRIGGFEASRIAPQNTLIGIEKLGKSPEFKAWANQNPEQARALMAELRSKFINARFKNASTAAKDAYFNTRLNAMKAQFGWRFKRGGSLPMLQAGGSVGDPWKIKLSPILDAATMLAQSKDYDKALNEQLRSDAEMKKYQEQAPRLVQQRFDLSPVKHKYNLAKDPYYKLKFNYSAPELNLAGNLSKTEQLSNLGMQEGAEESAYIDKYNEVYTNTLNQQNALNTTAANNNMKQLANLNARDHEIKAAGIRSKWADIYSPYLYQVRQNIRDAENKIAQNDYNIELEGIQQKYADAKNAALSGLRNQYNKAIADKTYTGSFENYLTSSDDIYNAYTKALDPLENREWKTATDTYTQKMHDLAKKYAWILSAKQGSKLRNTMEEMALQGDKFGKRAAQRASEGLMRMLTQLMK